MKNYGIKLLLLPIFLVLSLLPTNNAFGTDIAAGEVSFRCLGDSTYEITLEFYKSCLPHSFPGVSGEILLRVFDNNDNIVNGLPNGGFVRIELVSNDTLDLDIQSDCIVFSRPFCIHLLVYRGIVRLPYIEGGYRFYHNRCCRNFSNNIVSPTNQTFLFAGNIDDYSLQNCGSGPKFKNWPPLNVCIHTPFEFDHSLDSSVGDFAVYRFCELFSGNTADPPYDPIQWSDPYNLNNLLGGTVDPLRINPQTGMITGTPEIIGSFTVGVCVDEYLNGKLIREHRRDFQVAVADCHEFYADFFTASFSCNASDLQFENLTLGFTHLEWYFGGLENPLGFSTELDPTFSFPEGGSYEVVLIAYHEERGCRDTAIQMVVVQDREVEILIEIQRGPCGDTILLNLSAQILNDDNFDFEFLWEIRIGNRNRYFHNLNVEIEVSLVDEISVFFRGIDQISGCWITKSKVIKTGIIPNGGTIQYVNDCQDFVELNSTFFPSYEYLWYPDTFMLDPPTTPNPRVNPNIPMIYTVEITNEFCTAEIVFDVVLLNSDFKLLKDTLCNQLRIEIKDNPYLDIARQFQWRFHLEGQLIGSSISNFPTVNFPAYGNASISLIPFRPDSDYCVDTFTQDIFLMYQELDIFPDFIVGSCDDSIQLVIETGLSGNVSNQNLFKLINLLTRDTLTNTNGTFDFFVERINEIPFEILVYSEYGCEFYKQFSIFPDPLNELSGFSSYSLCKGDTLELVGPDFQGINFVWENTDYFISSPDVFNALVQPDSSVVYQLSMFVDNCEYLYTFEVEVNLPETFELPDLVICDSVLSHRLHLPNIGDYDSVFWIIGELSNPLVTSSEKDPLIDFHEFGVIEISLLVDDNKICGSLYKGNLFLSDISRWILNLDILEASCNGSTVELVMNGEVQGGLPDEDIGIYLVVNMTDTILFETSPLEWTFEDLVEIEIELMVKDSIGCSHFVIELLEFDLIHTDLFSDSLFLCSGDTINLLTGANPDYSYVWSPAFGFISPLTDPNPLVSPVQSIQYTANISSDNCTAEHVVYVEVIEGPSILSVSSDPEFLFEAGESFLSMNISGDFSEIIWSPSDLLDNPFVRNPVAFLEGTTTFWVVVADDFGCRDSAYITIAIEDRPCAPPFVFIPNAFSPNGDGYNDVLFVRGEQIIDMKLRIYNRYGQLVFISDDQSRGWDGNFEGEPMPPGVYGYHLFVECSDGALELQGNINLLR